jgi:hypothetical protein
MQCELSHDFVVGGFTDAQGKRVGLGALLVGYFEGDDFVFAGKVGTGFDTKLLTELRARFDAMELEKTPFTKASLKQHVMRTAGRFVRFPTLVEEFVKTESGPVAVDARLMRFHVRDQVLQRMSKIAISHPEGDVPRRRDHQRRAGGVLRAGPA